LLGDFCDYHKLFRDFKLIYLTQLFDSQAKECRTDRTARWSQLYISACNNVCNICRCTCTHL